MIRQPCVAGRFYPADLRSCRREAAGILEAATLPADLPAEVFGGLVPHAGWAYSGHPAAMTLKALAERGRLDRVVLLGSVHHAGVWGAAVFDRGAWAGPLGEASVDEELASALLEGCPLLMAAPMAHSAEHSIEVQLPFIQLLAPEVRIVPISVVPGLEAAEAGRQIGGILSRLFPAASVVGSTDLTHYGPGYGFTPGGMGASGLEWARRNDRRMLDLIEAMRGDEVVAEASRHQNACGSGAIAAAIAACSAMGAARGVCLEYTTSAEVMARATGRAGMDAVGYAGVIFAG